MEAFAAAFSTITVGTTVTFPLDPTFTPFTEAPADPLAALQTSVQGVRGTLQRLLDQIKAHKAAR